MGCACSKPNGSLSSTFLPQKQIMSPDLREDIHEELGVALVACSLKGWRKSQEDTSAIVINLGGHKDMLGVGVFDGHSGQEASKFVAANLWNEVTATTEWASSDIEGALKAAFLAVDASMQRQKVCHGTTAVVAVVTPGHLYVANCGDSRAVLCKEGVATPMSTDHKPCVCTEMSRVLRCGGQVIPGEFGGVARVTYPGCSVAMATSRSLGDFHFKRNYNSSPSEQVVSPAPEVMCVQRSAGDEFLILGTDGVWDVLNNQEVSDMMRASNRARRPAAEAPAVLPPATLWENSSAKSNAGGEGRVGGGARATPRGLELGDSAQGTGEGNQNGETASLVSTRRINGFAAPPVPPTPFHPPITPHASKAAAAAPFAVPFSGAAAAGGGDVDSYDSSDCGSSDAGSSEAEGETSHVGMDIDGDGGGGGGEKGGGGQSKRPAFVRLFTPTLLRLKTPTPPNPVVKAPQRGAAAAPAGTEATEVAAAEEEAGGGGGAGGERTRTCSPPGVVGGDGGESSGIRVIAGGVAAGSAGALTAVNGNSNHGGGGGGAGAGAAEGRGPEGDAGANAAVGGLGGAPGWSAGVGGSAEGEVCGGENAFLGDAAPTAGAASEGRAEAAAVEGSGATTATAAAASAAAAPPPPATEAPAAVTVARPSPAKGEGEGGQSSEVGVAPAPAPAAPLAAATPTAATPSTAATTAAKGVGARDGHDGGARGGSGAAAPAQSTETQKNVGSGNSCPASAEQRPPQTCTASDTAAAAIGTTAAAAKGDAKSISPREEGPIESSSPVEGSGGASGSGGGGSVVGAVADGKPSSVSGNAVGSWSTTTPPKTPVNQYNLPRGASGGNAARTPTIHETNTGATAPAPPPPAAAAAGASTSATAASAGSSGTVDTAAAAASPSAANVAPGTTATRAGGGGSSGGSTVGTTPIRLTSASSRTPGGSSGGGGGASASTSVSHTPSRRASLSRAATPTSRVNSYRRNSGSGLNLGLFKSSGSLSVSMSGRGDRSAVGAVQGVLDKALLKGSQDNMTIIAVDLRGLLDACPPDSASSTNL